MSVEPLLGYIGSIATTASEIIGNINLEHVRSLTLSIRATFGGSSTKDVYAYVYYSPDGKNYDTSALATLKIPHLSSVTRQVSEVINCPEEGYLQVSIYNEDTQTNTDVYCWYRKSDWSDSVTKES